MSRRLRAPCALLIAALGPMWATIPPSDSAPVSGSSPTRAPTSVMGPGATRDVSFATTSGGEDPGPADAAAISDDGRFIAFQWYPDRRGEIAANLSATRVMIRDAKAKAPIFISPRSIPATAPTLAADGSVLAYTAQRSGAVDVYAVDLSDPAEPTRRRITDRHDDVPFQRTTACAPVTVTQIDTTLGDCGSVLSGDGRSIAIPSVLSTISPQLQPRIEGQVDAPYLDTPGYHGLALVDFDAPNGAGGAPDRRIVAIRVSGPRAVRFDEALTGGDPAFSTYRPDPRTDGPPCAGSTVEAGDTCYVGIRFARRTGECGTPASGTLSISGPTPAAQTMVGLAGTHECPATAEAKTQSEPVEQADCAPLADPARTGRRPIRILETRGQRFHLVKPRSRGPRSRPNGSRPTRQRRRSRSSLMAALFNS